MSLQLLAKQMEAKGRKGDSMLVHMTADEVAGLQKLAESAGGSLTVNPETGLVEANFLKRMLPTLVGLGLAATGVGLPAAMAAGALTGGIQAKREDQNVGMGALLGGLGAMGGANLASGLAAAGSSAATGAAGSTVAQQAGQQAGQQAAQDAATQAAVSEGMKTSGAEAAQNVLQNQAASATAEGTIGEAAAQQAAARPTMYAYDDGSTLSALTDGAGQTSYTATPGTDVVQPATATSRLAQTGRGIEGLTTEGGRDAFATQFGTKSAMAGAAPLLMPEAYKPAEEDKLEEDNERYVYDYDPGRTFAERSGGSSAERKYFADERFKNRRTERVAQGGLLSLAEGGETAAPAEGMSGASKAAFDYLMGRSPSSTGQAAPMAQTARAAQTTGVGTGMQATADGVQYTYNPATQTFTKIEAPAPVSSGGGYDLGGGFDGGMFADRYNPFGFGGFGAGDGAGDYGGPGPDPDTGGDYSGSAAQGGLVGLAKGGMASGGFVVPADVVSALGNGSTDAGLRSLNAMLGKIKPIKGKGDGLSDSIPTNIDGKQPARVADGEAYIDPKTVKRVGGAKKLYAMMDKVRAQAHGKTSQQRKVNPAKVMA